MSKFKDGTIKNGPWLKKGVVETPSPKVHTPAKGKIRERIETEVGDTKTILANLSDTVSLLTSSLNTVVSVLTEDQLAAMDPNERAALLYLGQKKGQTVTSADIDFASKGTEKLDELLDSQGKIGKIMLEEKYDN